MAPHDLLYILHCVRTSGSDGQGDSATYVSGILRVGMETLRDIAVSDL